MATYSQEPQQVPLTPVLLTLVVKAKPSPGRVHTDAMENESTVAHGVHVSVSRQQATPEREVGQIVTADFEPSKGA